MSELAITPSGLMEAGRVLLDVNTDSKKRAFEEIGLAFENTNGPARGLVFKHLLERERLGSTIISDGVAIPHARLETLNQPLVAYMRALNPFLYDSPDRKVQHMFILLVPNKADDSHLKLLSIMTRILTDKSFIENAGKCASRAELLELVQEWESANLPSDVRRQASAS